MACAGAPESLADMLEIETDCVLDFAVIVKICCAMVVKTEKHADIAQVPARQVKIEHLPITFPSDGPSREKKTLMHLVDIIKNVEDNFDYPTVASLMKQMAFSELPGLLCPKKAIAHGFHMNLNIVPTDAQQCDIVKHYVFDGQVPAHVAAEIVHGQAMVLNIGSNKKAGAKPFMYMMQRLRGFTSSFVKLQLRNKSGKKAALEQPEDIDAGYDLIQKECPRANSKNEQNRWIDKQVSDPDSKVFGWAVTRVASACRNLKDAGSHASSETEYPLYFGHFEIWFQNIMKTIIPRLDTETMMWLGVPGAGKTQGQYIVGFAMARCHIWEDSKEGIVSPACRTAPDFDCFKNEEGNKYRSTLFDDGDLDRMPPRKTKAFHDGKKQNSLSVERYTTAKFVAKEFRSSADNKVDLIAEPHLIINKAKHPLTVGYEGTSLETFLGMIKPAFGIGWTPEDVEAVLRRATILVNTRWWLYVRPAGSYEDAPQIERYRMETLKFITPESLGILEKLHKTGLKLPKEDEERMIDEEQALFRRLLRSEQSNPSLDGDSPVLPVGQGHGDTSQGAGSSSGIGGPPSCHLGASELSPQKRTLIQKVEEIAAKKRKAEMVMIRVPGEFASMMLVPRPTVGILDEAGLLEEVQTETGVSWSFRSGVDVDVQYQALHAMVPETTQRMLEKKFVRRSHALDLLRAAEEREAEQEIEEMRYHDHMFEDSLHLNVMEPHPSDVVAVDVDGGDMSACDRP